MPLNHGNSEISIRSNIIVAKLSGAFNKIGVEEYNQKVLDAINTLNYHPFSMLIDNTMVEGGTPDAFEALNRFNTWMVTQPLLAKAFVYKGSVLKGVMEQRLPALRSIPTEYFEDYKTALDWLEQF